MHHDQPLTSYCRQCKSNICYKCALLLEHKTHDVSKITDVSSPLKKEIMLVKNALQCRSLRYQLLQRQISEAASKEINNLQGRQVSILKQMAEFSRNFEKKVRDLEANLHLELKRKFRSQGNSKFEIDEIHTIISTMGSFEDLNDDELAASSSAIDPYIQSLGTINDDMALNIQFKYVKENVYGPMTLHPGKHPEIMGILT